MGEYQKWSQCLLVHTRLSSVTLSEAKGLGVEEHQFYTVQVKNTNFVSETLFPITAILQTAIKLKP